MALGKPRQPLPTAFPSHALEGPRAILIFPPLFPVPRRDSSPQPWPVVILGRSPNAVVSAAPWKELNGAHPTSGLTASFPPNSTHFAVFRSGCLPKVLFEQRIPSLKKKWKARKPLLKVGTMNSTNP